jgi:hypothetical protein
MPYYRINFRLRGIDVTLRKYAQTIEEVIAWVKETFNIVEDDIYAIEEE